MIKTIDINKELVQKQKLREYQKMYREMNKERIKAQKLKRKEENPEKIREQRKVWDKKRILLKRS